MHLASKPVILIELANEKLNEKGNLHAKQIYSKEKSEGEISSIPKPKSTKAIYSSKVCHRWNAQLEHSATTHNYNTRYIASNS